MSLSKIAEGSARGKFRAKVRPTRARDTQGERKEELYQAAFQHTVDVRCEISYPSRARRFSVRVSVTPPPSPPVYIRPLACATLGNLVHLSPQAQGFAIAVRGPPGTAVSGGETADPSTRSPSADTRLSPETREGAVDGSSRPAAGPLLRLSPPSAFVCEGADAASRLKTEWLADAPRVETRNRFESAEIAPDGAVWLWEREQHAPGCVSREKPHPRRKPGKGFNHV